jgi:hypothetical protein
MWLADLLVMVLLGLLFGLLWMSWQFKIYRGKLKAQEAGLSICSRARS